MVEAIVPRNRNGLLIRLVVLTALLGIGTGVFFKATQTNAATNDFVYTVTDDTGAVAAAGETFNYTISLTDGAGTLATPGFLAVQVRFSTTGLNRAQIGTDFIFVNPSDANWTCSPDGDEPNLWLCLSNSAYSPLDVIPPITVPVQVLPGAVSGRVIRIYGQVDSTATAGFTADSNLGSANVTINSVADLAIDKGDVVGTVLAGASITFPITVENLGPSSSGVITVTDIVPAGLTLAQGPGNFNAGNGWSCSAPSQIAGTQITCTHAALAPNGFSGFELQFTVNADTAAGTIINTAVVADNVVDDAGADSDTGSVGVGATIDLGILKTVGSPTASAGSAVVYSLDYTASGAAFPAPATVTDSLTAPLGYAYTVTAAPGWVCAPTMGNSPGTPVNISCDGVIAGPGTGDVATVTVAIPADAVSGTISNSAVITPTGIGVTDPNQANNAVGPITATIAAEGDISLTKCAVSSVPGAFCETPLTANAVGTPFLYRVVLGNAGPATAPANTVSVGDSLPTNVAFTGQPLVNGGTPASAGWTCTPATLNTGGASVTCTNTTDPIEVSPTAVYIDYPVVILPAAVAGSQVCNQASANVTAPLTDPNPANNTNAAGTACVTVVTISDLGISKSANVSEIVPGGSFTYAITVNNAGPSAAVNPYFIDDMAPGLKVTSVNAPGGWTCRTEPGGAVINNGYQGDIRCSYAGSFAVGASATIFVNVQADLLALGGDDTIVNTASVNIPAGSNSEFLCPNAAAGDPEDAPADTTCGGLADSASASVEVLEYDVTVAKDAIVADEPQAPYLPGAIFAGGQVTYDITIGNLGPDDAPVNTVSLGDGRDNELDLIGTLNMSAAPQFVPQCVVGPDNQNQFNESFTCVNQGGALASGDSATISYTASVKPATPAGTLVCNSATVAVTPAGADTLLDNNEAEICHTVVTASDLSIIKTGPSSAQAGQLIQYGIVISNNSVAPALAPAFYDAVPTGTTFQSIQAPSGWACFNDATGFAPIPGAAAGTVIRCDGPQQFTGSAVITFTVRVLPATVGTVENNLPITVDAVLFGNGACVVPGVEDYTNANGDTGEINDDPNLANNCDTESTTLNALTEISVLKTALNPLYAGMGGDDAAPPYDAPSVYRIEVRNLGPGPANDLVFQDLLPAGVTLANVPDPLQYISGATSTVTNQATLSLACATYTGTAGTDTCALGSLAAGITLKFNVLVDLAPDIEDFEEQDCNGNPTPEPGVQVCNRATFTSSSFDQSIFNQTNVPVAITEFDDDKQTIGTMSDLSIVKTDNTLGGLTCSGSDCNFTYTIAVDNLGPSDTTVPVQFTDFFPPYLTITDINLASAPGWFCENLPASPLPFGNKNVELPLTTSLGTPGTGIVCSNDPLNFEVGAPQAIIEIDVLVLAEAVDGTILNNNVCLWTNGTPPSPVNDPNLTNNCDTNTIEVSNGNTISGTKWLDLDGDGNPADVELETLAGFEIFVDDGRGLGGVANDGIKQAGELSSITAADGTYSISGLIGGGPWRVCEVVSTGYTQTGVDIDSVIFLPAPPPPFLTPGAVVEVDLPSGQTCVDVTFQTSSAPEKEATNVDFLNFENFSISGFKFEDVNGNGSGVIEANESGVDDPEFTLYVDYNDNGVLDAGEPSSQQITGFPVGDYRISNVGPCQLTANICQVREVRQAGWIQTFPNTGVANPPFTNGDGVPNYPYDPDVNNPLNPVASTAHAVPVPAVAGADDPLNNFSNFKLVSITGLKYNDLDADGLAREAGEPTLAGFKICWDYDGDGCNALDPEVPTTGADGTYTILVGPGTIFDICENLQTSPSGWTATFPVDDSNANCYYSIAADSGDVVANINFGNFQNIVQGFKWNDKSVPPALPNGTWEPDGLDTLPDTADDEVGMPGWLICAIPVDDPGQSPSDCNPSRQYKATTDADGFYQIRDLPGGTTYRICEELKAGWVQTYPGGNNCHTLAIPATSGPNVVDHIFGYDVPGDTEPFNFGNNSPLPPVDLSIVKSAPATVVVNGNLDFTFTVTNNSAAPATNVELTDTVNPALSTVFVGTISPTPAAWTCSFAGGILDCARTGTMPANSTETVKVRFTAAAVPSGGAVENTVCVSADNPDPNTGNNCSTTTPGTVVSVTPPQQPGADLVLDKAASPLTAPQQLGPNKNITYRIRVRNAGPGQATNIRVTDVLTAGLKFQSVSSTGGYSCNFPAVNATGTVTCTRATLNSGASSIIQFIVRTPSPVPPDGSGLNQATVEQCTDATYTTCTTSLNDPNPNNNIRQAQASLP